jgi:Ca2+-binding RTX toxin-like protein
VATINGTANHDHLTGTAEADFLYGFDGNDTLNGKEGADRMYGGGGSDLFFVDDEGDQVFEDAIIGWDIVYTTLGYYALPANVESLRYTGSASFMGVGNSGNNGLMGGSGDDTLNGLDGADSMTGGLGDDFYWVNDNGDTVDEKAGEGYDSICIAGGITAYTLPANVERMVFLGSGGFQLFGNTLDNILTGGAWNDILNGYTGSDLMEGLAGNDLYFVDNVGDVVVEEANEGIDTIRTTLSAYTLPANVENLTYNGLFGIAFTGIGNGLDNVIDGGDAGDYLDGGAGADTMNGRGGNDVYVVDHILDQVIEHATGGVDEVRTTLGSRTEYNKMYILPHNVENLTGTSASGQGVYGNTLDNMMRMGAGGDLVVLHDGGIDTVFGGDGNDFLYFGGAYTTADSVDGGTGFDTLGLLASYDLTFAANSLLGIEKLAVYGSGGFPPAQYKLTTIDANVAAGQTLLVAGLSLQGGESLAFNGSAETNGAFMIYGGKGTDTLTAGAGNDRLYGNLGADTLSGGAGRDVFEYRSAPESDRRAQDKILDFANGDKIDLWAIDADGNAANGNSGFTFVGSKSFTSAAGQLRVSNLSAGEWLVEGDINGDAIADLSILVTTTGGHILAGSDFVL